MAVHPVLKVSPSGTRFLARHVEGTRPLPWPPWNARRGAGWVSGFWIASLILALIGRGSAVQFDAPAHGDSSFFITLLTNVPWSLALAWALYGGFWYSVCLLLCSCVISGPVGTIPTLNALLGLLVFHCLQAAFPFDTRLRKVPALCLFVFGVFCASAATAGGLNDNWETRWGQQFVQGLLAIPMGLLLGAWIEERKQQLFGSLPAVRRTHRERFFALLLCLLTVVVFCIFWTLGAEAPVNASIDSLVKNSAIRTELEQTQRRALSHVAAIMALLLGAVSGGACFVMLMFQRYREQLRAEIERGTEALRRRHAQLAVLQQVTESACRTLDPALVLSEMARSVAQLADAAQVAVYVLDPQDAGYLFLTQKLCVRPQEFAHPVRVPIHASFTAKCFHTGAIVNIPKNLPAFAEGDALRAHFEAHNLEAFLSIPIMGERNMLGVLNLAFDREYAADEEEHRLFRLIGDAAGTALERAETYAKARRYAGELGGLYRFSQQLAGESEERRLLVAATVSARRLLRASSAAMFIVAGEQRWGHIRCAAFDGAKAAEKAAFFRQLEIAPDASGLIAEAIRDVRTLGVGIRALATVPEILGPDWSERSAVVVPLPPGVQEAADAGPAGALVLTFDGTQAIGLEASGLIEELARQTGAGLRRARLIEKTRQQAAELKLLEQVGRSLSQHLSIANTLEQLVQNVNKVISAQWASVFVHDPATETIGVRATTFTQPGANDICIPVSARSLVATCMREGRTLISNDMNNDPRCSPEHNLRFQTASGICIPLGPAVRRFGVLMVNNSQAGDFSQDEVQRLEQVAQLASAAIERAKLYEEACQRADELILLNEVGHLLVENPALDNTLKRIAELVCRQFGFNGAGFLLLNEKRDALVSRGATGAVSDKLERILVPLNSPGVTTQAFQQNHMVLIEDAVNDTRVNPMLFTVLPELRSGVAIPMAGPRGPVGVLCVWKYQPYRFPPRHLQCLGGIARLAAAAAGRDQLGHALRASEERLQEIVDGIQAMVVSIDGLGNILSFNAAAERISGLTRNAVLGGSLAKISHTAQNEQAKLDAYLAHAFQTLDCSTEMVINWLPVKGTERKIRWNASFLRAQDSKPSGMVCFGVDITEQMMLEAQLLQAQKMESVGALAGGMAHDFNNLLGGIIGQCVLARTQFKPSDALQDSLVKIEAAAQRGADLTAKLMAFARKSVLQPRAVDIEALIRETSGLLSGSLPRSIQISSRFSYPLPLIHGDPTQLQQVLLNLCVNARDAMPDGGILTLTASPMLAQAPSAQTSDKRAKADLSGGLLIEITDTGMGMSDDVLQHLFEPFFTTKEPGKGTGLGLSLVFGIVRSHGGQINCFSQPGKGTRFSIRLPSMPAVPGAIVRPPLSPGKSKKEVQAPVFAGSSSMQRAIAFGGTESLLLVDDDSILRDTMRQLLEALGYSVRTAPSGVDALKTMDADHTFTPTLVLMDVVMPGLSGLALFHELRKRLPCAPVILMSGYSADETVGNLLNAGARELIQKPFAIETLANAIRQALENDVQK